METEYSLKKRNEGKRIMKLKHALWSLLLLVGCAHGALMTHHDYADIQVGTNIKEVEKIYGSPVQIRSDGDRFVYEYIERIKMGLQTIEMRKYYFVVNKQGKIVNKFTKDQNPPAYDEIYSDDMFPDQGG